MADRDERVSTKPIATEAQEQAALCEWLELHRICYAHPANEGKRSRITGHNLKRQGLQPGLPDILIFDAPRDGDNIGVAIELKRQKGAVVQDSQRAWLERLSNRGWATAICYGAEDAIEWLTLLGFGRAES